MANLGQNVVNMINHKNVKDLSGRVFGRLTVICRAGSDKRRHALWLCRCECGEERVVSSTALISGGTLSCGCYVRDINKERMATHGKSKTRLFNIWMGMKQRCYNPKVKPYKYYGEKGVVICNSWLDDYQNFYDWSMANGYADNLTIDRIDVNGNYTPENCRWIPLEQQSKNRTCTILYNGFDQNEWAHKLGVSPSMLVQYKNRNNCDLEKAVRFYIIRNYV